MSMVTHAFALGLAVVAVAGVPGCRTSPAPPAGFVDADRMTDQEHMPFQRMWVDPEHEGDRFDTLFIAPVRTDFLLEQDWWKKVGSGYAFSDYEKDVETIAGYMQEAVAEAFRDDPKGRFRVVEVPEDDTLVFELALVELVPSEPALSAAGFVVPGLGFLNRPSAAYEGRVVDASSGDVVFEVAERDHMNLTAVNITVIRSWYDPAKVIIDQWAEQFVEVANSEFDPEERGSFKFDLISW